MSVGRPAASKAASARSSATLNTGVSGCCRAAEIAKSWKSTSPPGTTARASRRTTAAGSGKVHEHQPADQRVERARRLPAQHVRLLEHDVVQPAASCAARGGGDGVRRCLDREDAHRPADEVRRDQRHPAGAGADLEHVHAGPETTATEGVLGGRPVVLRLDVEPLQLVRVEPRT